MKKIACAFFEDFSEYTFACLKRFLDYAAGQAVDHAVIIQSNEDIDGWLDELEQIIDLGGAYPDLKVHVLIGRGWAMSMSFDMLRQLNARYDHVQSCLSELDLRPEGVNMMLYSGMQKYISDDLSFYLSNLHEDGLDKVFMISKGRDGEQKIHKGRFSQVYYSQLTDSSFVASLYEIDDRGVKTTLLAEGDTPAGAA